MLLSIYFDKTMICVLLRKAFDSNITYKIYHATINHMMTKFGGSYVLISRNKITRKSLSQGFVSKQI
jgi:uncharacterized protein (DUF1330 family)